MGGLIQAIPAIQDDSYQGDLKITLSSEGSALAIMTHNRVSSRKPDIAIITNGEDGYYIHKISATDIGSGFTVSEDGTYIKCSGLSSLKIVTIIPLGETNANISRM